MSRTKSLAAALVAGCLLAVAAVSPASAQNIANPNGTLFGGGAPAPMVWSFAGGAVVVQCPGVNPAGNPAPLGVNPNALGGVSTRMARFFPTFAGCTGNVGGVVFAANVVANCDWAYAVDSWNGVPGTSTERLQIGLGCPNPLNAVTITIPGSGCAIALHQQPLIHNGANINVTGQNLPVPPAAPAALRITHNIANAVARTAGAGCPFGNPLPLGNMGGVLQLNGVWAGP